VPLLCSRYALLFPSKAVFDSEILSIVRIARHPDKRISDPGGRSG
jgi:hypothetical protein